MDEVLFTENIHKLIQKSDHYRSSMNNFFLNKHGSAHMSPQRPNDNKRPKVEALMTDQISMTYEYHRQKQHQSVHQVNHKDSGKNRAHKSMFPAATFMINLSSHNIDTLTPNMMKGYVLKEVQLLDLSDNRLRFLPKEILQLEKLRVLNLNSNFLKQLPVEIFNSFKLLQSLSLNNNLLTNIHHSVENWSNQLQSLDISNNRIDSIATITRLTNLKSLSIHSNEFKVLTYTFCWLNQLRELSLDWFKYTFPPMNILQKDIVIIQKLQLLIRDSQIQEIDNTGVINLSADDLEVEEGVTFKEFVQFFSESPGSLPNLINKNPQGQGSESSPRNQVNLIHKASLEQDIGVLTFLIKEYPTLIDSLDINGYSALALAIKEEKYFSAKTLIFNGADVNAGRTPNGNILNMAIVKGQIHMINDLLTQGANPIVVDYQGNGPLHYCMAVFDRDPKIYQKALTALMKHGADPNLKNKDGWTPLHIAAKKGVIEAIEAIISHNKQHPENRFDMTLRGGKKGFSALHIAAQNNNYDLTFILLNKQQISPLTLNHLDMVAATCCPHNYRLMKLLKKFEYDQLRMHMRGDKFQIEHIYDRLQDDADSVEVDENIQVFEALQHKTMLISTSLWVDVFGSKDQTLFFTAKQKSSRQSSQQRQHLEIQRILEYINHLNSCFIRAKFEAFKEDNQKSLQILAVIIKVQQEVTQLQKKINYLNQSLGVIQRQNPSVTASQVQHCLFQLLNCKFRLKQPDFQPNISPSAKPSERTLNGVTRSNKFVPLRNSLQLQPNFLVNKKSESQGSLQTYQSKQPLNNDLSYECPKTPTVANESYQDESLSNIDEMVRSKKPCQLDALEQMAYAENLIKMQSHILISQVQKVHLTQLVQSPHPLMSFEALQSLNSLNRLRMENLSAYPTSHSKTMISHQQQIQIQGLIQQRIQ